MTPGRCGRTIALLSFTACAAMAAPAAAEITGFSPHRAVYDMKLLRTKPGSGITEMTGRMVYELTGSTCEGFAQNMRFVTRSSSDDGGETTSDIRTSSWEDANGSRLRFNSTQYQNDAVVEASQGDARRNGASPEGVTVELTKPSTKTAQLPSNVTFPMQHAVRMIEAAKAGDTYLSVNLYDGSEKGEKYYQTTAFIGRKFEPGSKRLPTTAKISETLDALPSWPISISYFEPGTDKIDSPPSYELSFRYFVNGVTSTLKIDYGDFALTGELSELQFLPQTKCTQ